MKNLKEEEKKLSKIANWFGDFFEEFPTALNRDLEPDLNHMIYKQPKKAAEECIKHLKMLNTNLYRLNKLTDDPFSPDYEWVTSMINLIRFSYVELPPELACIRYICSHYAPALIALELNPDGIVSQETGEMIFNFRNDTFESFFKKYLEDTGKSGNL